MSDEVNTYIIYAATGRADGQSIVRECALGLADQLDADGDTYGRVTAALVEDSIPDELELNRFLDYEFGPEDDIEDEQTQRRVDAAAKVTDALADLYRVCNLDAEQVGEILYEVDKAARINANTSDET